MNDVLAVVMVCLASELSEADALQDSKEKSRIF